MPRSVLAWGLAIGGLLVLLDPAPFTSFAEEQSIHGEVVDPGMYLRDGSRGPDVVDRTYEAVDGGQTLAVLEDGTNTLYLLLAEQPGEDPNELVYDYVNQRLTVTGTVYERAGLKGIVIQAVQPIAAADTTAIEPQAASTP